MDLTPASSFHQSPQLGILLLTRSGRPFDECSLTRCPAAVNEERVAGDEGRGG